MSILLNLLYKALLVKINTHFIENQQFAIIYKVYLYSGQNVDKKYNFIEGMNVNFVDKDGNKIDEVEFWKNFAKEKKEDKNENSCSRR